MIAAPAEMSLSHTAAEWRTAIGTVAVAFVAVFQEWLKRIIFRLRLKLEARVPRP
jgi:hypothetical protein